MVIQFKINVKKGFDSLIKAQGDLSKVAHGRGKKIALWSLWMLENDGKVVTYDSVKTEFTRIELLAYGKSPEHEVNNAIASGIKHKFLIKV